MHSTTGRPPTDTRDVLAADLAAGREIEIGGVLSDMDGTLVDSVPAVEEAWRILASEFGVPMLTIGSHGLTVQAVVTAFGIPADDRRRAEDRLTEIESRDGQLLDPLPGVPELIASLPTSRWGIVTSAARPVARARFGATRLPFPTFLVTGDDVVTGKPAPEPFAKGLQELRHRGCDGPVIALEDTIAGLRSAHAAGCLAVGVVGTFSRDELAPHAHLVVPSLEAMRVRPEGDRLRVRSTPG
ncbi:sugar-phosphatase [Krasilnikoviella flava]|uniref:Sugar-phosphatase n=2 Tax=Krasilnikoviella flava TaxID=526729 RepID=A0A1T5IGK2_9MICO|nr:sugar-phosphatase [Krasilnikoviella flava]